MRAIVLNLFLLRGLRFVVDFHCPSGKARDSLESKVAVEFSFVFNPYFIELLTRQPEDCPQLL